MTKGARADPEVLRYAQDDKAALRMTKTLRFLVDKLFFEIKNLNILFYGHELYCRGAVDRDCNTGRGMPERGPGDSKFYNWYSGFVYTGG